MKLKNEYWKIFKICFVFKSKYELCFWCTIRNACMDVWKVSFDFQFKNEIKIENFANEFYVRKNVY